MQSRRHEDYDSQSSLDRRHRNTDFGRDGYLRMSPRSKRSCSPRKMDGPMHSDRAMTGRRSISLERRPYDDGRRIRSRSPYKEAERRRPFYKDDWVSDRDLLTPGQRSRYEFFDHLDMKHDDPDYTPARNEFGYGYGSSRTALRDDKFEGRRFDTGMREISGQRLMVSGLYKSTGDVGSTLKPETSADLKSAPLNIGFGQPGKERIHYPDVRDPYSFEKFTSMKLYGDKEKNMAPPRDTYADLAVNRSKESIGASHFKDYERTSPKKSRIDHLDYRGGIPLSRDGPPLNSRHMPEPLPNSRYEQRQHLDVHRHRDTDLEINDDMAPYKEERFSPPRTGHLDSFRLQPRTHKKDDYMYPSNEIFEKRDLNERVDYSGRDMLKPNLLDRVTQRAETSDMVYRNMSSRGSLDRIPLTAAHNVGFSRSSTEKRERAQYVDTVTIHSRLGRKVSREDELPYMGMARDEEIEHVRVDYDYERGLSPGYHKERMRSFPGILYEREHITEGHDLSPYDSSSRYPKRKYAMDDEENMIPSRGMMSRLDTVNRRNNQDIRDEEWIDEDARRSSFSRRRHKIYDYDDEFMYDPDEFIHDHDHHMNSHKYDDKYEKGYLRSSKVGRNSYHPNRRNVLPRWKNAPTRTENEEEVNMYSHVIDHSEPREDTKEFKGLVNDYFLSFTKKLNENPVVRRRYVEQGRAVADSIGQLVLVNEAQSTPGQILGLCSLSKEFLDTQRLAMHAFMSHKSGLRAQHLGLLKAICVMLGWNSVIPADTPRWFPETLSTTETLAQKQDLIIWPPVVVVHNISILNNSSKGEGPTNVEALGQYLRGIGLSGGKVKLGKPANCSIMLVKFLGTFSGLQDAEKIHQYFSKNKHGRQQLDQITSGKGKSNREESGKNTDKEAERVLFGYMGIAEDLDKVDIDTKRKCSIKSKKDIQDIADAPVKPGE
ncbi:hypothetical protein E3N88_38087 [Mikania micrantha]|uniref:XS domain-containing protein n=1 Tax=Mikania micrantha TaxID=192012 RepID=A0A5N6LTA9_9ASTR|nr:hypothetical protein E3N88_38087 [Mikania micrantha]